jgi:hypothetical protein
MLGYLRKGFHPGKAQNSMETIAYSGRPIFSPSKADYVSYAPLKPSISGLRIMLPGH